MSEYLTENQDEKNNLEEFSDSPTITEETELEPEIEEELETEPEIEEESEPEPEEEEESLYLEGILDDFLSNVYSIYELEQSLINQNNSIGEDFFDLIYYKLIEDLTDKLYIALDVDPFVKQKMLLKVNPTQYITTFLTHHILRKFGDLSYGLMRISENTNLPIQNLSLMLFNLALPSKEALENILDQLEIDDDKKQFLLGVLDSYLNNPRSNPLVVIPPDILEQTKETIPELNNIQQQMLMEENLNNPTSTPPDVSMSEEDNSLNFSEPVNTIMNSTPRPINVNKFPDVFDYIKQYAHKSPSRVFKQPFVPPKF